MVGYRYHFCEAEVRNVSWQWALCLLANLTFYIGPSGIPEAQLFPPLFSFLFNWSILYRLAGDFWHTGEKSVLLGPW